MQDNLAILAQNISKSYRLYKTHSDRVKEAFHPFKKKYHTLFEALKNVSFEIRRGETFGIIGRNGTGKSTLLQIICNILEPTGGTIEVNGRVGAILDLGAGFNPEYTGKQNIFMKGAILGYKQEEIKERFHEIESFADIGEFIDQPVKMYSSGMYLRLAFSIATSIDAEVLVIDEALAVGDVFFRQKCYRRLEKLREKGVAIVLVSHAMNEVEQFCSRALILDEGKIHFSGSSNEAVKRYYLLDQRNHANKIISISNLENSIPENVKQKEPMRWPEDRAFLNINDLTQVSNGWAKCTEVSICNTKLEPQNNFHQGETVLFFYEFELLHDIDVVVGGIVIQNDKGITIHGKNTLEYDTPVPVQINKGKKIRFRQQIKLELAIGEYTFEVGLAALNCHEYNNRKSIPYEIFNSHIIRLCHLPKAGHFVINFRPIGKNIQLLHHGLVNLQGNCDVYVVDQ